LSENYGKTFKGES